MKSIIKNIVACLPLLGLACGCADKEDIVFDIEKPHFDVRDNAILLEVIPPLGTKEADNIYIVGAFNGGEEEAVGNVQWLCEKSTAADKWGIYLFPSEFKAGKTLADGFYFVSEKEGVERTLKNGDALHTLSVAPGSRTNVTVSRWASYFLEPDDDVPPPPVEHDGYAVYVLNETSWDAITVYMWGDQNDLNGGWPGMAPTGKEKVGEYDLIYFDMGEANNGLNENLIFNNNGGGVQHSDFNFTIDRNIYLRITDTGVEEFDPFYVPVVHDGFVVYVLNETSWGDQLAMYMWGDQNNLNGDWPGMAPTGKEKVDGVEYVYFDLGAANEGLGENLIFNNNGGGSQLADFFITINRDYFLKITDSGVTEITNAE